MKSFVALLLLAVFAASINGQTSRATRGPPPPRANVSSRAPNRQQAPVARPTPRPSPSRAPPPNRPAPGPTRQSQPRPAPPSPTRSTVTTRAQNIPPQPPMPTRSDPNAQPTPPMPTRQTSAGPGNPQVPNLPGWPEVPTAGTPMPPHNGRPVTRPPRISLTGIPDARCPMNQPANNRNPVHLPHQSNCERFYKCDHGLAFEYQCPIGQHWNAMRNYCDFPGNANCGGNNIWNNNVPQFPNNNVPQFPNNPQWQQPNNNVPQWNGNRLPDFQNPIEIPMSPNGK